MERPYKKGEFQKDHVLTAPYPTPADLAAVQAFAIDRANHTGTQRAATISDFNAAVLATVRPVIPQTGNFTANEADIDARYLIDMSGGGFQGLLRDSGHGVVVGQTRWTFSIVAGGGNKFDIGLENGSDHLYVYFGGSSFDITGGTLWEATQVASNIIISYVGGGIYMVDSIDGDWVKV